MTKSFQEKLVLYSEGLLSKEDFLNPHYVEQKVSQVLKNSFAHFPSKYYLDVLIKAKEKLDSIPDINIQADRIKGRVFALIDYFRNELGEDYEILKNYSYCGSTPEQSLLRIHDLKNVLSGLTYSKYANEPELTRELLLISNDIVQIINAPSEDSFQLSELLSRLTSNLKRIYAGVAINNNVPNDIRILKPDSYSRNLYSLIENAVNAAWSNGTNKVELDYEPNSESMIISNKGSLPSDWLAQDGTPIPEKIRTSKNFGTGNGIAQVMRSLQSIGKPLTYEAIGGIVYTRVGLEVVGSTTDRVDVKRTANPSVLFLDYTDGERFEGIEYIINNLNPKFHYVWDSELNLGYTPLREYNFDEHFLVIIHPDTFMKGGRFDSLMGEEVVRKTPNLRYGIVSLTSEDTFNQRMYTYQEFLKENRIKKNLISHQDFHVGNLPSADSLNELIASSYEKYQAGLSQKISSKG